MKESLIIILFSIIVFLFIYFNNNGVIALTVKNDTKKYYVRNSKTKQHSANILSEIMTRLYKLKDYLYENSSNFLEDKIENWEINKFKYDNDAVDKFYKFLNNKEKDKVKNKVKEEIKLILYNNRLKD